jgi:hypothetical protein
VPPELLEKKVVRFAPPHVGIPEAARELKMDLIVISTQGALVCSMSCWAAQPLGLYAMLRAPF